MDAFPESSAQRTGDAAQVELRHFTAFQQVYLTKDYTAAGHDLNTDRKSILRMMERLEMVFRNQLFSEPRRGVLIASPFADRLYNDLKILSAAQLALAEEMSSIQAHGRPVRIGGSPVIFRTALFRTVFRNFQTSAKIRTTYVPVNSGDAVKALTAGSCDIYVGCGTVKAGRFESRTVGKLPFRYLERKGKPVDPDARPWLVTSSEIRIEPFPPALTANRPLDESAFLQWIDHPETCPAGTIILAPEIPVDESQWLARDPASPGWCEISLHYLRQHPYEFLPALAKTVSNPSSPP